MNLCGRGAPDAGVVVTPGGWYKGCPSSREVNSDSGSAGVSVSEDDVSFSFEAKLQYPGSSPDSL